MKTSIMQINAYREHYGDPMGGRNSEEKLAFYKKVTALTISDVLIVEPEKGQSLDSLRARLHGMLKKFALTANFTPRFYINRSEGHVAVLKLAKVAGGK